EDDAAPDGRELRRGLRGDRDAGRRVRPVHGQHVGQRERVPLVLGDAEQPTPEPHAQSLGLPTLARADGAAATGWLTAPTAARDGSRSPAATKTCDSLSYGVGPVRSVWTFTSVSCCA